MSCVDSFYKSRCPCLKSKIGCIGCQCVWCCNPYGRREEQEVVFHPRVRKKAQIDTKRVNGGDYLIIKGDAPNAGK